ncbi:MAG TPA: hypothetical protein VF719_02215, partial [Abditibacteriaceae bacterium]
MAELKNGNMAHLEPVIAFLERDSYCHGSGYSKEKIWRLLPRVELTKKQKARLLGVSLQYVHTRMSREFFAMCRFIRGIAPPEFAEKVRNLAECDDEQVARRAYV